MDAKLKALKVVDLKAILTTAAVQIPPKANKNDLIAKILDSQPARDAYTRIHEPHLLVEPTDALEELPEEPLPLPAPASPAPASTTAPPPQPVPAPASAPATTPAQAVPTTNAPSSTSDQELEKRKQRAARFGIPLVDPKQPRARSAATPSVANTVDEEKLKARAARFGLSTPLTAQSKPTATGPSARPPKRAAAQEQVDPEEEERRKKRAERFGTVAKS